MGGARAVRPAAVWPGDRRVPFEQIGPGTYFVLAGLLFGKPIGILLFAGAARLAGARLPQGLRVADLVVIGITAAIGFTVSLFFATAAFPGERHWPKRRWGRLSFGAAPWRSWRRDC